MTVNRKLIIITTVLHCVVAASVLRASPNHHPDKEDTYTITSVVQILQPVNPAEMTDDFQDTRLLGQDENSATVQVTYYPLYQPTIGENPNWRTDDAGMTECLQPTPTENWDPAMRHELVTQLKQDGIDPDRLTDKELVVRVSRWAFNRAHSTNAFGIWAVYFPNKQPVVLPALRDVFDRQKPDPAWSDQQMFQQELLGKSMFYNKVHGSCTSYSVYQATILRALGIPTRIVICIPPFDANDDAQATMFYDAIHHNQVRETVRGALQGVNGFDNHLFNEVYVGGHWVRLNYERLGQPVLDRNYFGLLTHIYTCSSLSDAPLAQTWGMRYFRYPADQPKFSSINPYRLISIQDHFGKNARVNNPEVPVAEYRTVTIEALYPRNSAALPDFFRNPELAKRSIDFFISYKERIEATHPMRIFYGRAGHDFLLSAPGHPTVKAHWTGASVSADGVETCAAQIDADDKAKFVPGVSYAIQPINISDTYRWVVAPGVTLTE